jgi:hypothetical protein
MAVTYIEETNPTGGEQKRDESYPTGKTMDLPAGKLSLEVPGNGMNVTHREGTIHPRSVAHCADAMVKITPGSAIGKATYTKG